MRVIFMGTPDFSVPVLETLLAAGHEIAAVYCQPPRPAGRGQANRPCPVELCARGRGLPVRSPKNFRDPADVAAFADLNADVAVVVAYGLILPQMVLDAPRLGCLNIHASLLPRWRGAAPIQRAIMAGDRETGICIMQMAAGLDTGPVIRRETVPIRADDTGGSLHDRLSALGARMINEVLTDLPRAAVPQEPTGVSYAAKINKAEAMIDWTRPATEVDCHIRGLSPFPGAWTLIDGHRVKVLMSSAVTGTGAPGRVLDSELTIACGTGAVRLLLVQREGRSAMTSADFQRGFPVPSGTVLGP